MGAPYRAPRIGAIVKSVFTPAYRRMLDLLRAAREEAGLSQRDLAARLDVAPSWVAKVELGERRLDVVEFIRVTTALECKPVKLLREIERAMRS